MAYFFEKHLIATLNNAKKNKTQITYDEQSIMEKENSPFISNNNKKTGSFVMKSYPNMEFSLQNQNINQLSYDEDKHIPEEKMDFISNFSHSLKKLNERDFLSIFKGKVAESVECEERCRSMTHDGVLDSKHLIEQIQNLKKDNGSDLSEKESLSTEKLKNEKDEVIEKQKEKNHLPNRNFVDNSLYEVPNERFERSISALDDYTNFFGNNGTLTQKFKANKFDIMKNKDKYPIQQSFIDENDDENNPNIEGHLKIISPHKAITSNNGKFRIGSISTKPVFKGNFTDKLQNVKVVTRKKSMKI